MSKGRIANLAARVSSAFSFPSRQDIELNYLNKSISINDLERRQHQIAAGKFRFY